MLIVEAPIVKRRSSGLFPLMVVLMRVLVKGRIKGRIERMHGGCRSCVDDRTTFRLKFFPAWFASSVRTYGQHRLRPSHFSSHKGGQAFVGRLAGM
jgi:hypothetical protein